MIVVGMSALRRDDAAAIQATLSSLTATLYVYAGWLDQPSCVVVTFFLLVYNRTLATDMCHVRDVRSPNLRTAQWNGLNVLQLVCRTLFFSAIMRNR